jgi:CHAT domain-containing protein
MAEPGLDAIRDARRELDETIDEIRKVPGYEQFLAPPTFGDVARAAGVCPIVYLAAAELGGLALVVRSADVVHVPLPQLSADSLRARVTAHLDAYAGYRIDRDAHRVDWSRSLDEITAWLWGAVVGPVLEQVRPAAEAVFVPGGLLGLLPLHAAWTSDPTRPTGRRYALDELAISYTPNARSLQVARDAAAQLAPTALVAVAEPRPVPASDLPSAPYEALTVLSGFGPESVVLRGGEATRRAFGRESARATVLHLACHGYADLADPLDSGLLMAGGPVTLRDLLNDYRLQVRLAVLSACETALPGTELPDEVVALPTGLLQAGVAGIVASQWSVPDRATAMLMAEFYRRWSLGEVPVAVALRDSQRWLRDTPNQRKRDRWRAQAGQRWLPAEVADYFDTAMLGQEPDARAHENIHMWAAFAHVGA